MQPEFWRGKKVLITGHTGFKGSWLSLWLQGLGALVSGYSLQPPTPQNLFSEGRVAGGMDSIQGDVRNLPYLKSVLSNAQPEIVIHMAAQSLVRASYQNPVETYTTNITGTVHILEAVRKSKSVRVLVNVTSDKCYENTETETCFVENDPMGGFDPYSSSKACSELVTSAYRNSFFSKENGSPSGVAVATARAGNVIGGGDWSRDRLVPDIMSALMAERPVVIRSPEAVRHWQHVLEPLEGYLTLAERLWESGQRFADSWNFGPAENESRSVLWIVKKLTSAWGEKACWEIDPSEHPHEAANLRLDSSKANIHLGWRSKVSLETALEWIVEWYKGYQKKEDMHQVTHRQITRCQNMVQA